MITRIGDGAIVLDGEGAGVTLEAIQKMARGFRSLFKVRPDIHLRGRFTRAAMAPDAAANRSGPDVWDWTLVSYYQRVSRVGPVFLVVQLESPLPGVGAVEVRPDLGTMVSLRFALP